MQENTLEMLHQDGVLTFKLVKGGYCIDDNYLSIFAKCKNIDSDSYPDIAWFQIRHCSINGSLMVGSCFACEGGLLIDEAEFDEEELTLELTPTASAYFGFHPQFVNLKFTVTEIRGTTIVFKLEAEHDDTNYYDSRAKPCTSRGVFVLNTISSKELW
ncbi:MAG: hypothetical protein SFX18_09690 [Pirellulales bacterium]|nr:hypothetical protein [Pirellulales bacterium]